MRKTLIALVIGGMTVTSGVAASAVSAAPSSLVSGPCPDYVPTSPRLECGTVEMPEDHARPNGTQIKLAVAIIHPEQVQDPNATPLLFLSGGPGDQALGEVQGFLDRPWVTDRDMVVVDLRGTGSSEPYLGCPEADAVDQTGARSDDAATRRKYLAGVKACRDRLTGEGVNIRLYNYEQITADLADLRVVLGYKEWNVYGISNGGRVALELVRRHPKGIRSLIFDASLPPQGNYYGELWPHAKHDFDVLFDACAADDHCATAHPDLEDRFFKWTDSLRTDPVSVTVTNPNTGEPTKVVFDDILAFTVLRGALYDTSLFPILPSVIDGLIRGEGYDFVATEVLRRLPGGRDFSLGENLSDNCREQVAFIPKQTLPQQAKRLRKYRRAILAADDLMRDECRVWNAGKADRSFSKPVHSSLPALVLVGSFDPVHPRDSAEAIASGFKNSKLFEFPGLGHGTVFAHDCPLSMVQPFLVDPHADVDASCIDEMGPPVFN